jgi:hypothetical protein
MLCGSDLLALTKEGQVPQKSLDDWAFKPWTSEAETYLPDHLMSELTLRPTTRTL